MMTQDNALAILKSGKNVFLTGSAGAGKTYVLNQYIDYLKTCGVPVAVTASTGIAATHMNGMTIHAWSGIGVKDTLAPKDIAAMREKKYLSDKLEDAQVLIIDEISMLHRQQLDLVNLVLKSFKNNHLAFGGIQVVFSGDFFQLPPVGKPFEEPKDKFAFMSNAWQEAEPCICYISEQHRQSDNTLNKILNSMRNGNPEGEELKALESSMQRKAKDSSLLTRLYTHNHDVDRLNIDYLRQLPDEAKMFKAEMKGSDALKDMLRKSILTDENLELRKGARVMFIKNNYEKGYMNGTTGEITGFNDKGFPWVKIKSGMKILAEPEDWSIQDDKGKTLASFKQIPLRLAWAITIHKSQGMTLDEAIVDLGKTFEKGQGYVALSRLRDLEHLYLEGFNSLALQVDSLALKADKRFRELSAQANERWPKEELEKRWDLFVETCGGTPYAKAISEGLGKKSKKGKGKTKAVKGNTYEETAELVAKGLSIESIAAHRGISANTILSHLTKLKVSHEDLDFSHLKPEKSHIKMVEAAIEKISHKSGQKAEKLALNPIHNELKGKLSFDEIRLVLLFIDL